MMNKSTDMETNCERHNSSERFDVLSAQEISCLFLFYVSLNSNWKILALKMCEFYKTPMAILFDTDTFLLCTLKQYVHMSLSEKWARDTAR